MPTNRKKSNKNLIIAIIAIIFVIILVLVVSINKTSKNENTVNNTEKAEIEHKEEVKKQVSKKLYNKTEEERIRYYCGDFFKKVENQNYEEAYNLLYSVYKENYFPTIENFKKYFQDYFPAELIISYNNFERIGDYYILMVTISDAINGSYGKSFDMYVVIKENSVGDYVLSFSRNSAVNNEEE